MVHILHWEDQGNNCKVSDYVTEKSHYRFHVEENLDPALNLGNTCSLMISFIDKDDNYNPCQIFINHYKNHVDIDSSINDFIDVHNEIYCKMPLVKNLQQVNFHEFMFYGIITKNWLMEITEGSEIGSFIIYITNETIRESYGIRFSNIPPAVDFLNTLSMRANNGAEITPELIKQLVEECGMDDAEDVAGLLEDE